MTGSAEFRKKAFFDIVVTDCGNIMVDNGFTANDSSQIIFILFQNSILDNVFFWFVHLNACF
jgi:hypothetical protein